MTTTLYHSATPVKPNRRRFGAGIFPASRALEPSADDRLWWAQESARLEAAREAAHFDAMAAESYATDCLCRGLNPAEMA